MQNVAEPILDAKAILGEGALWDDDKKVLYWVDILGRKVNIYDPEKHENFVYPVDQDVGTVVPYRSGDLLIAMRDGFARLKLDSGEVEMIVDLKKEGLRINDGKCDPAGRFWAGSMAYDLTEGAGTLYRMGSDYQVYKVLDDPTLSNGLVWTSDHNTFYYIDSMTYRVDAFDYNIDSGAITNRRTAFAIDRKLGIPDGMTIDEADMLWIAHYGGGRVTRWDPNQGILLSEITVPSAKLVTSCAFGGTNLDELYITTASGDLNQDERIEQPLAGDLFRIQLDIKGRPASKFNA